jgi:hypothetical protein
VLAHNRPTKASSSAAGGSSALANDGDPATAWRADAAAGSSSGSVSWEVFLEVAYDVDRIALVFPEEAAHRFIVEVSADGGAPVRVIDQSDNRTPLRRVFASGSFGKKLDTVRVRFAAGAGQPASALAEVFVGGPGPAALPAGRLGGVVIGTPGSWQGDPAATREAAFDGNLATFVDAKEPNGAWTGLDLGVGGAARVTEILFAPRAQPGGDEALRARMVGGRFQGANKADFSDAQDLAAVAATPMPGLVNKLPVGNAGRFRYLRYLSPEGGNCNVAEIVFAGGR